MFSESMHQFQETNENFLEIEDINQFSSGSFNHEYDSGTFRMPPSAVQETATMFDDIALSDEFLCDYYSQVLYCELFIPLYFHKDIQMFRVCCNQDVCNFFVPYRK